MSNVMPSMDSAGWVSDVAGKADRALAYYFTTEASQSDIYFTKLVSLPSHVQRFGSNDSQLIDNVQRDLSEYLGRYFDTVEVNATTSKPNPEDPNRTNLTVSIIVTEAGVRYSVGHVIRTLNSKILSITKLNNFGER